MTIYGNTFIGVYVIGIHLVHIQEEDIVDRER